AFTGFALVAALREGGAIRRNTVGLRGRDDPRGGPVTTLQKQWCHSDSRQCTDLDLTSQEQVVMRVTRCCDFSSVADETCCEHTTYLSTTYTPAVRNLTGRRSECKLRSQS